MPKPNQNSAPSPKRNADRTAGPSANPSAPVPDAFTQIRQARDEIVAAIIRRAIDDGCCQRAKWLFEYGGLRPASAEAEEEEPGLLRLIWNELQIPEPPEEIAAEFSANDHAVE